MGSTFRIYLPRVLEQETPNRVAPLPEALPRGHEKILLVEDEEAVRKVAARILGGLGYSVVEATNGGEALRIVGASDRHFDLIVTDVVMPEVGGAGVAAALREAGSTAKVLFTSGYTDDSLLRHGVTEHSLAFLQKPFSSAQLARAVRDLLDAAP